MSLAAETNVHLDDAKHALKSAVADVRNGKIDEQTAVLRVKPEQIEKLLHPNLDPAHARKVIARGLPASPGAGSGEVVFSADEAEKRHRQGKRAVLVRIETSPEDINGMHAAVAILTIRGGMTSHAAVVARGMGRICVVGCADARIDLAQKLFVAGEQTVREGDVITVDGSTGEIMLGEMGTIAPELGDEFKTLLGWADKFRTMKVYANADSAQDAKLALEFGAEGLGLCRTEHMFGTSERMRLIRELIIARSEADRRKALDKLLPVQRSEFYQILRVMGTRPVTIRLLDPPLHEFLPNSDEDIAELAKSLSLPTRTLRQVRDSLIEHNPMLGHRGCRLGLTYPEIYEMQVRALLEAASDLARAGVKSQPEIMFPLIALREELDALRALTSRTAEAVSKERGLDIPYRSGTMIELPRAALIANELAHHSDFFSFGTNDLTQTALGVSRDDSGKFIGHYIERGIVTVDPFVSIDKSGVGELMTIACERGRKQKPHLTIGICGEHGSDAASIDYCQSLGLSYVSCSVFRVPVARLAAAQSALRRRTVT